MIEYILIEYGVPALKLESSRWVVFIPVLFDMLLFVTLQDDG